MSAHAGTVPSGSGTGSGSSGDADPALDGLVRVAAALTGMRCASVVTMDTAVMRVMAVHGFRGVSWPRAGSIVATVLARGPGAQTCDDLATEARFARSPWLDGRRGRMRAFGCAPVVLDGVLLAAVCVFDDAPHTFTDAERGRLADVATAVAALVRAAQQARELADLAAATQLAHTETARAHAELARSTAFTRALLEVLPVGVVGGDPDGRVSLFNATSRRWHGIDADPTVAPADLPASFRLTAPDGRPLDPHEVPLTRVYAEGRLDDVEIGIAGPDGLRRVSSSGVQVHDDDGNLLGVVLTLADVTEQRAGGEVLREAARRLQAAVRPGDTVARIGGDEFSVLCPEVGVESAARVIADRIARAFGTPLRRASGDAHQVGISIGIAMCGPADTADTVLACADAAMYRVTAARTADRVPAPRSEAPPPG